MVNEMAQHKMTKIVQFVGDMIIIIILFQKNGYYYLMRWINNEWKQKKEKKVELDGEKCCNKILFIYGIRQWLLLTE